MNQQTISVDELRDRLEQGEAVTILDVRPAAERAEWAIPGSIHVDAYAALRANDTAALADLDLPGNKPVVTVCGAGKTSLVAATQLRARGLTAVSLAGGMKAWSLAWNTAEVPLPDDQVCVIQVRRTGKGCLSYIVGSGGDAAVIDAALDPQVYLELADRYHWRISHVLDTHVHADHLSRGRQLADAAQATYYLPETGRVSFPVTAVTEGDVIPIGASRLKVLHTPGHTPESAGYLLDNQALFSGDTLFTTAVGRPDLEATPEGAEERAHHLYRSLQRLLSLPDETVILPGHTSEPVAFDNRPIAAALADVGRRTELLALPENAFVEQLLARIPPTPPNHHRIVHFNETGQWPLEKPAELEAGANRCAIG